MKYPYVIVKKVNGEWWYEGADATVEKASRTCFFMGKQGASVYEDGKIVYVESQEALDKLRKEVNNLPASL